LASSFKSFSIEFRPMLENIVEEEKILKELANNAAMAEIIGN
jgi:hypothetical protein